MTEESVQNSLVLYYAFLLLKQYFFILQSGCSFPSSAAPSLFPHSPLFPPPFLSWIKLT